MKQTTLLQKIRNAKPPFSALIKKVEISHPSTEGMDLPMIFLHIKEKNIKVIFGFGSLLYWPNSNDQEKQDGLAFVRCAYENGNLFASEWLLNHGYRKRKHGEGLTALEGEMSMFCTKIDALTPETITT